MKLTLTTSQAAHELLNDPNASWTYSGAYALVEYLEELEEDTGEEIEFCPCSIRCDYSQYASLIDWADDYFCTAGGMLDAIDLDSTADEDEIDEGIRNYLSDHGTLIEFDGGIIVSAF
jgi:hypothetical protein